MFPSSQDIEELHRKIAPTEEAFELVYTHCKIVRDIALQLLEYTPKQHIDIDLVIAGCLLHDIGTYSLYENGSFNQKKYLTHGVRGQNILADEDIDVRLQRIASHHTGVGITKDEIISQDLPLPHVDLTAETLEERLVMYADKFHSKGPQFNSFESYKRRVAEFGKNKAEIFEALKEEFGVPDLISLSKQYHHPIR